MICSGNEPSRPGIRPPCKRFAHRAPSRRASTHGIGTRRRDELRTEEPKVPHDPSFRAIARKMLEWHSRHWRARFCLVRRPAVTGIWCGKTLLHADRWRRGPGRGARGHVGGPRVCHGHQSRHRHNQKNPPHGLPPQTYVVLRSWSIQGSIGYRFSRRSSVTEAAQPWSTPDGTARKKRARGRQVNRQAPARPQGGVRMAR